MNLPNALTLSRFVWTVIFIYLLSRNSLSSTVMAAVVFTIAALTDLLDGYIAKKKGLITDFGKIMDPVADKFLMLAAFIMFVQMGVLEAWMVVLIFIREVAVTFSRILRLRRGQVLAAEKAGKIKTTFQILSISVVLIFLILEKSDLASGWSQSVENGWGLAINIMMFITVLLTVNSGVSYFQSLRKQAVL
ncbi:MAG: CDP-diacylglycerol--glycerol-3-phosphate 3-phosphatidyltransferase [Candidatus Omnitrophica bacterium]|nr:CDP-diacylglycerol--glycerol-3-phosphate 3-phosphatidyltransferase [Candidatus Omnitrophota bacterium]